MISSACAPIPIAVLECSEENGGRGGTQYALQAAATLNSTSIAIESDIGAFAPFALSVSGHPGAVAQARLLAPLLSRIDADRVTTGGSGADIGPMCAKGVPCAALDPLDFRLSPAGANNPCPGLAVGPYAAPPPLNDGYFFIHHSAADTIDRMDPGQLSRTAAAFAIWAVTIANLPELLQRDGPMPDPPPSPGPSVSVAAAAGGAAAAAIVIAGAVAGFIARRRALSQRGSVGFTTSGVYASLQAPVVVDGESQGSLPVN